MTTPLQSEMSLTCKGGLEEPLVAALADPLDFFFIPVPACFTLYADHDEYCTFFSTKKSRLSRLAHAFAELGVETVADYIRRF